MPGALASNLAGPAVTIVPPPPILRLPPPTPVITTIVARSATEIDLTWGAAVRATSYNVEESANGGAWTLLGGTSRNQRIALMNLKAATTYSFQVDARICSPIPNWSMPASATTFPAAPTVQVVDETQSSIEVTWNAMPGATGYTVQVGSATPVTVPASQNSYWAFGPASGTPYPFTVTAFNPSGGTPSAPVVGTTFAVAPYFTASSPSSSEIDLQWKAVPGYQISYLVQYATYSDAGTLLGIQTTSVPFATRSSALTRTR